MAAEHSNLANSRSEIQDVSCHKVETPPEDTAVSPQEAFLLSIMNSLWKNRCIAVIVELKIPELLCNIDNPSMSIDEIAAKSGCQTSTQLYPVMKVLAQWGIGKEFENKHFAENETMALLRRDKGPGLGHMFGYFSTEEHFTALKMLGACVKHGKPAFTSEHGMDHFTYIYDLEKSYNEQKMFEGSSRHKIGSDQRRREFAENYSNALTHISYLSTLPDRSNMKNIYNTFHWSTCNKIVDIGGNSGDFLASILKLPGCEHIQGYVVDLPGAVKEAEAKIQDLKIPGHRIQFIKHDILQPFPSDLDLQVDTIVFKETVDMFVHDIGLMGKILANCRSLFSSDGGRVVIIDFFSPRHKSDRVGKNGFEVGAFSIHWLSIAATPLLSKEEWMKQLQKAGEKVGFQLASFSDTFPGGLSIFELSYKANSF